MVMSMSSALRQKGGVVDIEDVQECLQGNLCRCTGYRPIVEGFSTFCKDKKKVAKKEEEEEDGYSEVLSLDMGDLAEYDPEKSDPKIPDEVKALASDGASVVIKGGDGRDWYRPATLEQLKQFQAELGNFEVFGGGTMFYRPPGNANPIVQVSGVRELKQVSCDNGKEIRIGAAVTLSELKAALSGMVMSSKLKSPAGRVVAEAFLKALRTLASPQVRNAATVGGSVAWGAACSESDLVPLYLVTGCTVEVLNPSGSVELKKMEEFSVQELPKKSVITAVVVPIPQEETTTGYYRVARRKEFSYPVANAGIQANVSTGKALGIKISFGGAESDLWSTKRFVPRLETELMSKLEGRSLKDLQDKAMQLELVGVTMRGDGDAPGEWKKYRQEQLASFLLSFFRGEDSDATGSKERRSRLTYQKVDEDQAEWDPVTRPVPNMWAAEQACGEAQYVDDIR